MGGLQCLEWSAAAKTSPWSGLCPRMLCHTLLCACFQLEYCVAPTVRRLCECLLQIACPHHDLV